MCTGRGTNPASEVLVCVVARDKEASKVKTKSTEQRTTNLRNKRQHPLKPMNGHSKYGLKLSTWLKTLLSWRAKGLWTGLGHNNEYGSKIRNRCL